MKALTTQVITMQTFFSVQSALLPVEPVYKLLVKARSYLSASQYCLKHTSLLLCTLLYHLYLWTCIHLLISSPHLSPSMHSKPCSSQVYLWRQSHMPSKPLSDYSTSFNCPKHHPFWLQIHLDSSVWPAPISHSPAPFLAMKSVITSVCQKDDSGRCGGPSDQIPHGLP